MFSCQCRRGETKFLCLIHTNLVKNPKSVHCAVWSGCNLTTLTLVPSWRNALALILSEAERRWCRRTGNNITWPATATASLYKVLIEPGHSSYLAFVKVLLIFVFKPSVLYIQLDLNFGPVYMKAVISTLSERAICSPRWPLFPKIAGETVVRFILDRATDYRWIAYKLDHSAKSVIFTRGCNFLHASRDQFETKAKFDPSDIIGRLLGREFSFRAFAMCQNTRYTGHNCAHFTQITREYFLRNYTILPLNFIIISFTSSFWAEFSDMYNRKQPSR